ncbi:MAG: Crp/Fnr family transcriptional regulator [Candidatus Bipolaricaulia bacterium]
MERTSQLDRCRTGCCTMIFSDLADQEFTELIALMTPISYSSHETIFREGTPVFGIYIICEGLVKVAEKFADGKQQILKLLGPGEILGEEALFIDEVYIDHAVTLSPVRVMFIRGEEFLDFLKGHPQVTFKLLEKLSRELKAFQSKLVETAYGCCEERLARLLWLAGEKYGVEEQDGLRIGVEFSRDELAEMTGVATETIIRGLGHLKEAGILSITGRRITIRDLPRLKALAHYLPVTAEESIL